MVIEFEPADPKIPVSEVLQVFENSQRDIADAVGCTRQAVNSWVINDIKFVPPLYAYRLCRVEPDYFNYDDYAEISTDRTGT